MCQNPFSAPKAPQLPPVAAATTTANPQASVAPAVDTSAAVASSGAARTNLDATRIGKNRLRIDLGGVDGGGSTGSTTGLGV
jgi:hypothetical protein